MSGERFRSDSPQPLGRHRLGALARRSQQPLGLPVGDGIAGHAAELRLGDDLPGLAPRAAVELCDQLAHRRLAAGVEQLVELGHVVPPRRRLAGIGRSECRQVTSHLRPMQDVVARQGRAEADLDAGATGYEVGSPRERRGRYDATTKDALTALWEASDRVCGKRLKVMIPTLLPALERHGRFSGRDSIRSCSVC